MSLKGSFIAGCSSWSSHRAFPKCGFLDQASDQNDLLEFMFSLLNIYIYCIYVNTDLPPNLYRVKLVAHHKLTH